MACNPTRLELSNTDATTVNVTVTADPGDGTAVVLDVPDLSLTASANTSGGTVSYVIAARTENTNSLWDATIQVGANAPADIVVQIVETAAAQTVGVTISDAAVTYCAPTAGGGTTSYSSLTSGTVQIDLLPSADNTRDLGSADVRWAEIHGDLDGAVMFRAKASTGTLAVGDVVYIDGVSGETPTVAKAAAGSASTMPAFGIISVGGTAPAEVYVTTLGSLDGVALPSATYTVGDTLYVSTTAGQFTKTPPTGESNLLQNIGYVAKVHDTNGIIKVGGAGRTNAVPNLNSGNVFYGNGSNQAVSTALTSVAEAAGAVSTHAAVTSGVHGISSFGATLVDDADAAAARTTLGLGTLATQSTIQDSYLMLMESPTVGKTFTLDGRAASARTITNYYAKTSSGTCTAVLKNLTDATTIGSITVTSTGTSAGSLSNTAVDENDRLGIEITIGSTPADLEIVVEYTA